MNANPEALKKALEGGTNELCGYLEAHTDEEIHADILALVASGGKGLRDEFAMAALLHPYATADGADRNPDKAATWAYQLADAMLAARSKQGEGV